MNESSATAVITAPQDFIQTELAKFSVTDAAIAEMRANFLTIKVADFNDRENAALARSRRLEVRAIRIATDKLREEMKADSIKFGKAVEKKAQSIIKPLQEIEAYLQEQEDIVAKYKARMEAEAQAKAAAEQAEREAERQALLAEKAEYERKIAELESEKRRQLELEAAREEAAKRAALETEARIKREAEAQARREKEEAERAIRVAAARPDREKLCQFAFEISNLPIPDVESEAAKEISREIVRRIDSLANFISERANAMGN